MRLTPDQILELFPRCAVPLAEALCEAMPRARIETLARIAAFLAQVGHESGGLSRLVENLNYSDPRRIAQIFRYGFDLDRDGQVDPEEIEFAKAFVGQPEKLANRAYADRMGNGDPESGDGWRYRGRGLIQITGRHNYTLAAAQLGLPLLTQPELLEQPGPAAESAVWFWRSNGLNERADADLFMQITRKINGGTHGHTERVALRERILRALRS